MKRRIFHCRRCGSHLHELLGFEYCTGCNWDAAEGAKLNIGWKKYLHLTRKSKCGSSF